MAVKMNNKNFQTKIEYDIKENNRNSVALTMANKLKEAKMEID